MTGGGSGIGYGIAYQLGLHGAKVCIMGRREAFLDEAVGKLEADGIEAMRCKGDVREDTDCLKAVARYLSSALAL